VYTLRFYLRFYSVYDFILNIFTFILEAYIKVTISLYLSLQGYILYTAVDRNETMQMNIIDPVTAMNNKYTKPQLYT